MVQRQIDTEEESPEEEKIIQTSPAAKQTPVVGSDLANRLQAMRGGGTPLPRSARDFFEPRFGYDFGQVRVHMNSEAAKAATSIKARALTFGRDVVFGAGQYLPGTESGRRLLAHELTHVIQQQRSQATESRNQLHITQHAILGEHVQCIRQPAMPCDRIRRQLMEVIRQLERIESQIESHREWIESGNRHRSDRSDEEEREWQIHVREQTRIIAQLEARRVQLLTREITLRDEFRTACGYEFPPRRRRERG